MSPLFSIFWLALVVKLGLTAWLPLTNDEAYYWVWSQKMQLSFYDHPPVVAWLFWIADTIGLRGGMVRWPGVLLGHGTLALWLSILKPYLSNQQRLVWLGLALLSPLIGGTNLIVTPDLPLLFFYAAALWLFYKWRSRPEPWLAGLFGLSLGLGFSAKYVMVLFPLAVFPLIFASSELRRPFWRSLPWVVVGSLVGSCPVWLWNIQNDFMSIRFQLDHGLGAPRWKWSWSTDYLLVQVGLIFPPVLFWALRAKDQLPSLYHSLAWLPLLFFFATTSRGYVEANWPIVAYPAVFALAVSSWPRNKKAMQITQGAWALALIGLTAVIALSPAWSLQTKLKEFHQFEKLLPLVEGRDPIYARNYQMAAKLHFELRRPIYKLRGMNRRDYYDFLDESLPSAKEYSVITFPGDKLPDEVAKLGHRVVESRPLVDEFMLWRVQAP